MFYGRRMVTTDYLDRISTHQSVNGVSGNAYKGFRTLDLAETSYNQWVEFLAQRAQGGPRVPAPISASQPRVPASVPTSALHSPVPRAPVVCAPSPAPPTPGLGSLRENPSPTLSDASSLGLGQDPWFVVAEGERPGVYHTRCAFSPLILNTALKLVLD